MTDPAAEPSADSWGADRMANVKAGRVCYQCGRWLFSEVGHPHRCNDCLRLDNDKGEIGHHSLIRCPFCKHQWSIWDEDMTGADCLLAEDTHDVGCPSCEREFRVRTKVSYEFMSPEVGSRWLEDDEEYGESDEEGVEDESEED